MRPRIAFLLILLVSSPDSTSAPGSDLVSLWEFDGALDDQAGLHRDNLKSATGVCFLNDAKKTIEADWLRQQQP